LFECARYNLELFASCGSFLLGFLFQGLLIQLSICVVLQRAAQFVAKYFPDFFDQSLRLPLYWTHLEAQVLKDVAAARGVWENLIKTQ
jgi:hypothetical protein